MLRKLAASIAGAALAVCTAAPANAQTYPSKPVRVVVPFAAGSITDIIARIVGQQLSQRLGQPLIIDNKPGADGSIAAAEVKRAAPDGYTLLLATNSPMSVVPHLQKTPPYDALADFTPISFLGNTTFMIVVNPGVPARTLGEFIAHAKANPKTLNYGTGNTTSIVTSALVASQAGIEMLHVPYKSEPQAVTDLVSGQIHFMVAAYSSVGGQIADGKLRPLATLLAQRTPLLPDVPSFIEVGQKQLTVGPWGAVVGPARMPKEVVERLNKEIVAVVATVDVKEKLVKQGFAAEASTPEGLGQFLADQHAGWAKAIKAAGLEAQ